MGSVLDGTFDTAMQARFQHNTVLTKEKCSQTLDRVLGQRHAFNGDISKPYEMECKAGAKASGVRHGHSGHRARKCLIASPFSLPPPAKYEHARHAGFPNLQKYFHGSFTIRSKMAAIIIA